MTEICWKDREEGFRPLTDRDEDTLWSRINKQQKTLRMKDMQWVLGSEFVPVHHPFKDYFYGLPKWQEGDDNYIKHVSRFEAPNMEEDQIRKHFRIPNPGEAYEVYSVADVLSVINMELKVQLSATKVGMLLNKMGYQKVRSKKARGYMVCRYTLEEISQNRKEKVVEGEEQVLPF